MDSKWFRFSKRAKIVLAGVLTSDIALIVTYLTNHTDGTLTVVGMLTGTTGPLIAYWQSSE